MKVCDVVLNSIWYDPRVRKQIIEYKKAGIEICCVGLKCNRYDLDKVNEIPVETNIVSIDSKLDGKQRFLYRKILRELARIRIVKNAIIETQADVIHANDLNALIPAYLANKKMKGILVYDSHEINVENYTAEGRSRFAVFMEFIEKFIVKRVSKMICVSNAAAEYFSSRYKIQRPMVITNCSLKKDIVITKSEDKHKGFEVLNHGQFYDGRGYDIMAESCSLFDEYPDIRLAIRGFGRLEKKLHDTVGEYEGSKFLFYPPVEITQLIREASYSHVGVAITEPLCLNFELSVSNKLFEYTSAGLPVIMSNIPEHRYLNERYHIGIVMNSNTVKSFVEAVLELYTNKDFYYECQRNAYKMANELCWENEFDTLIKEEKRMLGNK